MTQALFPPLSSGARRLTGSLPDLIDSVFPLPGRFRAGLPRDVAELSRLLTAGRADRNNSYLGRPDTLSAYLRYFLPWNIYRLCRLFSALPLDLKSHDAVNDLGAGPFTLAAALWISRPDLRNVPLEFRCMDRTAAVMEAGGKFFAALTAGSQGKTGNSVPAVPGSAGSGCPWVIRTVRGEIKPGGSLSVEIKGKPAALTAAVNVYNELFWNFPPFDKPGLERFARRQARLLSALTGENGSVLVVEPGIPRSGEFISLLRSALAEEGRMPLSPCVHRGACPLPGGRAAGTKAKWCHFAFDTEDAPEALHRLSAAAKIPKERAVLSFILAGPASRESAAGTPEPGRGIPPESVPVKIRVISDMFPVPTGNPENRLAAGIPRKKEKEGGGSWGRYGCSGDGLVLINGSRPALEASPSGALEEIPLENGAFDAKSGALVAKKSGPSTRATGKPRNQPLP